MEGIELLKNWKKSVNNAILQTWKAFNKDQQLFLTENDVKCFLYNELRNSRPNQPYAVHSEVTHYANYLPDSTYRFRDLVLLNPAKIRNNTFEDPLENMQGIKSKGFSHIGESVFLEIKFQRLKGIRINENDLLNLATYQYRGDEDHPKYAILIWASKHGFNCENNLQEQMGTALKCFSDNVKSGHIPFDRVFAFVFNHEEVHALEWTEGAWDLQKIAP